MNDDDPDLRIHARRESGLGRLAGPAPAVRAQTLPAAPVRTPPMSPMRARTTHAAHAPRRAARADAATEVATGEPPLRVTRELPAVQRAEPEPAPELAAGAAGAGRRITRELPVPPMAPAVEHILQILRAPQAWGETVKGASSRKERELAAVFEGLDPEEAGKLFRRLSNPQPDDPVAASFARLVPERRGRLLGFLISARGRAELAQAQRPPPQPRRNEA